MIANKEQENYKLPSTDDADILSDVRYICSSCSLITESLQRGADILQMPNGDIIVSELKRVTFQYSWDHKKGKLVRVQAGNRPKKPRLPEKAGFSLVTEDEEVFEEEEI